MKQNLEEKKEIFDFENLKVYQKAPDFVDKVYTVTDAFPKKEVYKPASQFTRAAYSIALNTGEGSAGPRKEFIHFIVTSKRSVRECLVCATISYRQNYIDQNAHFNLRKDLPEISKMPSGLSNYLESDKAKTIMSEPLVHYLRIPNSKLPTDTNG